MNPISYFSFIALFLITINCSHAQRFGAGFSLGANLSELNEDDIDSYIGLTAGIRGIAKMKKKWHLSTELAYSQQGDYIDIFSANIPLKRILVQYLEVPLQSHHLFLWDEVMQVYQIQLNYGVTYARLLQHHLISIDDVNISNQIVIENTSQLLANFGISGYFNKEWGIDFRGSMTFNGRFTLTFKGIYLI